MNATPWSTDTYLQSSPTLGIDQQVQVDLPARYDQLDSPTVIVCLDGPWVFGTVADAVRIMSTSREAPEAVVAGLAFTDSKVSDYMRQRARWFSPTPWVPHPEAGVKGLEAVECGRAEAYASFLADEFLPDLTARYPLTATAERWLVGHSFSALFALTTMLDAPGLFDRWMLLSPSIWWDDRTVLRRELAYAAAKDDLVTEVFVSAGSAEDDNSTAHLFNMRANVEELVSRLRARAYPSLILHHAILDGGTHSSCIGQGVAKGLRAFHRGSV